jgi:hypothetical protein
MLMAHTIAELISIVYRYYPVGIWDENPAYWASPEHQRKQAAIHASEPFDSKWQQVLDGLKARFPECALDDWTHLRHPGNIEVCYYGRLLLPRSPNGLDHIVVGLVSVLVPYYFIFCETALPHDMRHSAVRYQPMIIEDQYFRGVGEEIERAFGYGYMPPEVGLAIAPHVIAFNRIFGTATLYDCLFTDNRY